MALTEAAKKKLQRQRKREDGLRPLEVWVSSTPEAAEMIRQAEREALEKYPPTPLEKPLTRD